MENCIFCKIINKEIQSNIIYEDDIVLAFLDISPVKCGHTLIIPKKHYIDLDEINEETLNHIMKVSKILKKKIEDKLHPSGLQLVQNNGDLQEVKHYHLHLIPNYDKEVNLSIEEVFNLLK